MEEWGLKYATCAEVRLNFLHRADVLFVCRVQGRSWRPSLSPHLTRGTKKQNLIVDFIFTIWVLNSGPSMGFLLFFYFQDVFGGLVSKCLSWALGVLVEWRKQFFWNLRCQDYPGYLTRLGGCLLGHSPPSGDDGWHAKWCLAPHSAEVEGSPSALLVRVWGSILVGCMEVYAFTPILSLPQACISCWEIHCDLGCSQIRVDLLTTKHLLSENSWKFSS